MRSKRIYPESEPGDDCRVLIDHIWPRGVSHERAKLDEWARELAPSDELRRWFNQDPARFEKFRTRYRAELGDHTDWIDELRARARSDPLTILCAAHDQQHNNAVVLAEPVRDG